MVIHAMQELQIVLDKLLLHSGAVLMSSLSLAELQRGLFKRTTHTQTRRDRLAALLPQIPVLSFDSAAAESYGRILAQCGWVRGRDFDRMIAAHALSIRAVLVTDNEADFRDIPGLTVENWKH